MMYLFYGKGKAKEVFKALLEAALLESKFGRLHRVDVKNIGRN